MFEASSPVRYVTELYSLLNSTFHDILPVMFLYTDGGPDHLVYVVYVSVQLSLIAIVLTHYHLSEA